MQSGPLPKKLLFVLVVSVCTCYCSCVGTRDLSAVNLSNLYRNAEHFFHPEFTVVHSSDSTSRLLVLLNTKEFLFSRQPDDKFKAFFRIHYRLAEAYESIKVILDSGSTAFTISEE